MKNWVKLTTVGAGLVVGSLTAPAAKAQSASGAAAIDSADIIVTARKREERLIDVPVAVTALNAEAIARYGITDVKAITQNVPNVLISAVPTGSGATVNIRGLGSLGSDPGVPNEVVFNLDGVPVNRGRIIGVGLLDTQQIEVLKGPQALFFGKNSPAGVITILSADPGKNFGGYVNASYEFASVRPRIEGAVDIPVSPDLSIRLAGRLSRQRGYIRNVAVPLTDRFGLAPIVQPGAAHRYQDGSNEQIGRFTAVYNSGGPLRGSLKFTYGRSHLNSELGSSETTCGLGRTAPTTANGFGGPDQVDPAGDCKLNKVTTEGALNPSLAPFFPYSNGGKPYSLTKTYLGALNLTYESDALTVTSVSGFYGFDTRALANASISSFVFLVGGLAQRYRQYSQELRFDLQLADSFDFQFGGFYEYGRERFNPVPYFVPFGRDSRTGAVNSAMADYLATSKSFSAFASFGWDIVPTLRLSGGARYTRDRKRTTLQNLFVNDSLFRTIGINVLQPVGVPVVLPYRDHDISPEVTLSWRVGPDMNLYGAYKTAYKAGGTSEPNSLRITNGQNLKYEPEDAEGFEIGYKGLMLDRRLRVELVAYRYKFKNLQVSSLDTTRTPSVFRTTNAAGAKTQGVEAQVNYRATDALTIRATGSYNDAHYTSFAGAPCSSDQTLRLSPGCVGTPGSQNLSGRTLPRAPKWTGIFGSTYTVPVGALELSFDGDLTYNGKYNASDTLIPQGKQDAWLKVDAGVRLSSEQGWSIALTGRNLTDPAAASFRNAAE